MEDFSSEKKDINSFKKTPDPNGKLKIVSLISIVVLLGVLIFQVWTISKKNTEIQLLQQENMAGLEEQKKLNNYINDISGTISEVQNKLQDVRKKQVTISNMLTSAENNQSQKQKLFDDISAIENQMQKDKQDISELRAKMKKSGVRIKFLDEMVSNLQKELDKNQKTMVQLRSTIEQKDLTIKHKDTVIKSKQDSLTSTQENLKTVMGDLEETNQILDDTRNSGFYIIGTKKDLKQNNIIEETGNFLQKKSISISRNFDKNSFTKINITVDSEFPLNCKAKSAKLVPTRNESSYKLEDTGKDSSVLKILDYKEFWKIQYLVIITD